MAATTGIEWAHHTFNPWVGCTKVSPACDHCYAEAWAKRAGRDVWGPHAPRQRTAETTWRAPLKWNTAAKEAGERRRVFPSLCDPFDNAVPASWRADFIRLIAATPWLDWLLLTKRPQNAPTMMESAISEAFNAKWRASDGVPYLRNLWAGTTVENQDEALRRVPRVLKIPATVHFLSCEPLLGPVDLIAAKAFIQYLPAALDAAVPPRIGWVITGGESGPGARPSHPAWFRSLRDQCWATGTPFFFKQWGDWIASEAVDQPTYKGEHRYLGDGAHAFRIGKRAAGRDLDGRTWDQVPLAA